VRISAVSKADKFEGFGKGIRAGVGLIDQLTSEEFNRENYKDRIVLAYSRCWMYKGVADLNVWTDRQLQAFGFCSEEDTSVATYQVFAVCNACGDLHKVGITVSLPGATVDKRHRGRLS
jgi:hypothetical protein